MCVHDASPHGLGEVCWTTSADDGQAWRATLGPEGGHNRLRIEIGTTFCDDAGLAAAKVVGEALAAAGLAPGDLSVVVASPAYPAFVRSLAMHSGIDPDRVIVSRDEDLHTVSFLCAAGLGARERPVDPQRQRGLCFGWLGHHGGRSREHDYRHT